VQVAELLKKGACVSCHGDNFAKPIDPSYPKIAGQHADYLFVALKAYKVEKQHQHVGRGNAIMGGIAKQFTNAELKRCLQAMWARSKATCTRCPRRNSADAPRARTKQSPPCAGFVLFGAQSFVARRCTASI
jgi:cytochrome c553